MACLGGWRYAARTSSGAVVSEWDSGATLGELYAAWHAQSSGPMFLLAAMMRALLS